MPKLIAAIIVSAIAGAVLAGLFRVSDDAGVAGASEERGLQERLVAVEKALQGEREARQLLEDEVFRLIDDIDTRQARSYQAPRAAAAQPAQGAAEPAINVPPVNNPRRRDSAEDRAAQLISAGFSEDRASFIARREAELRLDAMQARFEATRNGEDFSFRDTALQADRKLRSELGDIEYEQYLEASGRPTAIAISGVMELSPAEQAGLQRGDQIVRYNGERVYNVIELNQLQLQGANGGTVRVDILRDGAPMQLELPQGPLGIQAGRGRRR